MSKNDKSNFLELANNNLLHYSNLIWSVRGLTIGQGILILSGVYLSWDSKDTSLLIIICAFGVLATIFLLIIQNNYLKDFEAYLKYIKKRKDNEVWKEYIKRHNQLDRNKTKEKFVRTGFYYLLILVFISIAIFKIINP